MLTQLNLRNFTAFESLSLPLCQGINIFLGENGTGKTHLLKILYAASEISQGPKSFSQKSIDVFHPLGRNGNRLLHRGPGVKSGSIEVYREGISIKANLNSKTGFTRTDGEQEWKKHPLQSTYIPVKEMLSHSRGFRALYSTRDIPFDDTHADIIDRALISPPRGKPSRDRAALMRILEQSLQGRVSVMEDREEFFLDNLEFALVAEGQRKLALLWRLIQNEMLVKGSTLFWDEPEANMNPSTLSVISQIIVKLQQMGVQIFIATHHLLVMHELSLASRQKKIPIQNHFLLRSKDKKLVVESNSDHAKLSSDPIGLAHQNAFDRELTYRIGLAGDK